MHSGEVVRVMWPTLALARWVDHGNIRKANLFELSINLTSSAGNLNPKQYFHYPRPALARNNIKNAV